MDPDEDGLDDDAVAPLLPPDDRLWRHPSELGSSARARAVPQEPPRLLTIVALTSAISVLLTLGIVAVILPVGAGDGAAEPAPSPVAQPASFDRLTDVATIAEGLRAAVTKVSASGAAGDREGSGVVYRRDGLVLTAHHIVDGAERLLVTLDDGRTLAARLVGGDPDTDIAVLDVDGESFEVAPLGSAKTLKAGQAAISLGSPEGGAGPVVSVAIVSATGREVEAGGRRMLDMIQTDAAFSPGCSGGPLVDTAGKVIGITTMNVPHEGGANGYATPIDVARGVAGQIVVNGRVTRGWLGVEGDTVAPAAAAELKVTGGVLLRGVKPSSPADAAGLRAGDVILSIDGRAVGSMVDLVVELRAHAPGDDVVIGYQRGGSAHTVVVELSERPG